MAAQTAGLREVVKAAAVQLMVRRMGQPWLRLKAMPLASQWEVPLVRELASSLACAWELTLAWLWDTQTVKLTAMLLVRLWVQSMAQRMLLRRSARWMVLRSATVPSLIPILSQIPGLSRSQCQSLTQHQRQPRLQWVHW